MALWKNTDLNTSAPKFHVDSGHGVDANGYTLYGNTQVSAFETGAAVGVFGVDAAEANVAHSTKEKLAHAGWVLRHAYTGPVTSIAVTGGNIGYNANGYIVFTSPDGSGSGANASYTVNTTTNTITTITLVSGGSGYTTTLTANAANATTVNSATFLVRMGGRANRVQTETIVAMGSMSGDGSDDTIYPDA